MVEKSTADLLFEQGDAAQDAGDFEAARQAFERGAALGSPHCWSRLGYIYDVGIGCPIDKSRAMQCYRKAWRQRDTAAATNIAILYREEGNWRAMFRWFKRAADAGDGDACVDIAKCFALGIGTRRNIAAAIRWLMAAIESNFITPAGREEAEAILHGLGPEGTPIQPDEDRDLWGPRQTLGETSPEVVASIENVQLLHDRFGKWPSFHDFEVLSLQFDRGNLKKIFQTQDWSEVIHPSLTVIFKGFDIGHSSDSPERKPTLITLRFHAAFERFALDGFNHQNPIVGMEIIFEYSENLKKNLFAVDWGGTGLHHDASFTCERIEVLSVEPLAEE